MKKWIVLIVAIGVGIGGYSVWNRKNTAAAATVTNTRPTTATISSRDIRFVVNAAGDIGPDDMVSVRPEVNGRISELPVDIGDEVKKGDLLCALDDRDLQTERASRMTDIEGAKLQLQQAQRVYERSQRLYADTLISQEVFQDSETTYKLAKNALDRAQKALDQVDDQLSKTRIVAPFDCTILTRPVSIGQAVSGSAGYNSGTEVMTIANLKEMIIMAHMNQADVIRLKAGQKVDVQVQAVPGLTMVGMVERVAPQATLKNNIKGFATQIRLKNIDPRVRPGMTANMTIPVASAENVLAIPIAAVFTEQGERYAYVRTGDQQFEMRPIELGISDYQFAQITGGLSDGEVVSLVRPQMGAIVKMPASGTEKAVEKVATLNSSAAAAR
ncbi:MAG TPA: efflux RND transporter periplasmic adaptor subunit [Verrucomicrobiae bacterium]|jgi:RND family efflux transporter MFP subunit|nr:efflux RND transporter periplasmic adaptor subunit [Verrucomicrobiae bacterium]